MDDSVHILACICGAAGTGKSFVLKAISTYASQKHSLNVTKLATTGAAAHLIGGSTVHSFFKLSIDQKCFLEKGTPEFLSVKNCDLLAIDEFSMLDLSLFTKIEKLCRETAPSHLRFKLFGGKHIILLGDPLQLPAIRTSIYSSIIFSTYFQFHILKEVQRQDNPVFQQLLSKVRVGQHDEDVDSILTSRLCSPPTSNEDLEDASIVVSTIAERDIWNMKILESMDKQFTTFQALDTDGDGGELPECEKSRIKLYHKEKYPDNLQICEGCSVILLKNIDIKNGWVNGTIATVISIFKDIIIIKSLRSGKLLPVARGIQNLQFKAGTSKDLPQQFPLTLGWAITCHKIQGQTLKKAFIELNSHFFASGQAYVVLRRVKSIEGLHLLSYDPKAIIIGDYERRIWEAMTNREIPWPQPPKRENDKITQDALPPKQENDKISEDTLPPKRKIDQISEDTLPPKRERNTVSDEEKAHTDNEKDENEHKTENNSASIITHVHNAPPLHFNPVDFVWQYDRASNFHIAVEIPIQAPRTSMIEVTKPPVQTIHIIGDGNCFFRCLSWIVSGTQNHHLFFRDLIVQYIEENIAIFHRRHVNSIDYVRTSGMYRSGTFATEVEIFAAAYLLNTTIETFSPYGPHSHRWQRHLPISNAPSIFSSSNKSIFLKNTNVHFEVVTRM